MKHLKSSLIGLFAVACISDAAAQPIPAAGVLGGTTDNFYGVQAPKPRSAAPVVARTEADVRLRDVQPRKPAPRRVTARIPAAAPQTLAPQPQPYATAVAPMPVPQQIPQPASRGFFGSTAAPVPQPQQPMMQAANVPNNGGWRGFFAATPRQPNQSRGLFGGQQSGPPAPAGYYPPASTGSVY